MTKFFAQLFLSAMIALGAAAGFNPGMKDKLAETLSEAKAMAHEATRSALDAVAGLGLNGDISVSLSAKGDASAAVQADARTEAERSAALDLDGLFHEVAGVDGSLSAESQSDANVENSGFGFNLTNAIHSALGFGE